MTSKRSREDEQKEVEAVAMANCLMLLSQIGKSETVSTDRVFECKTCNKQFHSFQALGGHRASHKRPKLTAGDLQQMPVMPKSHECSICGVEFALGQALGGHMRRHRAAMENNSTSNYNTIDSGVSVTIISNDSLVPVLKKTNSCKKAWGLDLNLMPYDHNYLKLGW